MKRFIVMILALAVIPAMAQAKTDEKHRVSYEAAKARAEAKAPKAILASHEIEHQHDHLVYSFEFIERGKSGFKKVKVDAETGKVIKVAHESPKSAASSGKSPTTY